MEKDNNVNDYDYVVKQIEVLEEVKRKLEIEINNKEIDVSNEKKICGNLEMEIDSLDYQISNMMLDYSVSKSNSMVANVVDYLIVIANSMLVPFLKLPVIFLCMISVIASVAEIFAFRLIVSLIYFYKSNTCLKSKEFLKLKDEIDDKQKELDIIREKIALLEEDFDVSKAKYESCICDIAKNKLQLQILDGNLNEMDFLTVNEDISVSKGKVRTRVLKNDNDKR